MAHTAGVSLAGNQGTTRVNLVCATITTVPVSPSRSGYVGSSRPTLRVDDFTIAAKILPEMAKPPPPVLADGG